MVSSTLKESADEPLPKTAASAEKAEVTEAAALWVLTAF